MALIACGGVGGGGTTPPQVTVTVNPGLATLFASEAGNSWPTGATQQQFKATVNGSTDQSVTWAVTGGSANGAVDGNGLYTTPAVVPKSGDSDGYGHIGRGRDSGIGFCDSGDANGNGDIADYGDGYGNGWGGARVCGNADCAVEAIYRRDAEDARKTLY